MNKSTMASPYIYGREEPSASNNISQPLVYMGRSFKRHSSRNRRSLATATILLVFMLYILWPSNRSSTHPHLYKTPSRYDHTPPAKRADAVKEVFAHAYSAYEKYALPDDEYKPVSNTSQQNFNGWGVTMFDALDTLWLMGMQPEYERAVERIAQVDFKQDTEDHAMFFETVIRYLGGLLSAYALSGNRVLLQKADELGTKLLPVFNTKSGLAAFGVNTNTGELDLGPRKEKVILAEFASCQMEYKYLAHLTGNTDYFMKTDRAMSVLQETQPENGLWSTMWDMSTGESVKDAQTIGAWADSAYEYLLKQYLMSGRSEIRLVDMHIKATNGVISNLLYLSPTRDILYVTDLSTGLPSRKLEHLSCFYPGLLALTLSQISNLLTPSEKELYTWAAEGLAYTCYLLYADQPSGLAPEEVAFTRLDDVKRKAYGAAKPKPKAADAVITPTVPVPTNEELRKDGLWIDVVKKWRAAGRVGAKPPGVAGRTKPLRGGRNEDYRILNRKYLLRPEAVETMYMMWRLTEDEVWRERGWEIFLAIERASRTPDAYASVNGVDRKVEYVGWLDEMPSYALAETWKYLYLLFLPHDPLPLDKYVFNTEAHPLPVFQWSEREKQAYNIS